MEVIASCNLAQRPFQTTPRLIALHTCPCLQRSLASNIKPVRGFLRYSNREEPHTLKSWCFLRRRGGKVGSFHAACSSPESVRSATTTRKPGSFNSHVNDGRLAAIMRFLPLKEVFREYCQRALCSEVCRRCMICLNFGLLTWWCSLRLMHRKFFASRHRSPGLGVVAGGPR